MSRVITVIQSDEACGWFVIEDGMVTGGLSTDEALAHVAARMLVEWPGFPRESLSSTTGALFRERMNIVKAANAVEAAA